MRRFFRRSSTQVGAGFLVLLVLLYHRQAFHWPEPNDSGSNTNDAEPTEPSETQDSNSDPPDDSSPSELDICSRIRNVEDVTIVIKTAATELWEKVPPLLLSNLACAHDVLIYSDLEDDVANIPVFDALKDIPEETKTKNRDFELYQLQKQYRNDFADLAELKKEHGEEAGTLDKYKAVYTVEDAFKRRPNSSWYLFIDADTYIVWSSLLPWVEWLDPAERLYIGSAAYSGDLAFGHGGSGYMLSQAAMRHYIENTGEATTLLNVSSEQCCGDLVMGKVLSRAGINLTNVWPMFSRENVRTIPYGSNPFGYADHWCEPMMTMHHVTPREINDFWQYETLRAPYSGPILFKEFYEHSVAGHELSERSDWDNLSRDKPAEKNQERANQSFEECGQVCAAEDGCYQYLYSDHKCTIGKGMVSGERPSTKDKAKYRSGWNLKKWDKFKGKTCDEPHWIMNRPS